MLLSVLMTSFLIKNGLVIFYITGRTLLADGEGIRPDIEKEKKGLLDAERIRPDIEKEETKPTNTEGLADAEG